MDDTFEIKDPYVMVMEKHEQEKINARDNNEHYLNIWDKSYDEIIEGLKEYQRIEEKKALENEKNLDKNGYLKNSVKRQIEQKYAIDRKVLDVFTNLLRQVCSGSLARENNLGNYESLCILRNLPPKYTRMVSDAFRRDQLICNKKCNKVFSQLLMISNADKKGSTIGNYNKKFFLRLDRMFKRLCSNATKIEFFEGVNTGNKSNILS